MKFLIGRSWYAEEEFPETRLVTAASISKLLGLGTSREGDMYARTRSDERVSGQMTDSLSNQHSRAFQLYVVAYVVRITEVSKSNMASFKTLIGKYKALRLVCKTLLATCGVAEAERATEGFLGSIRHGDTSACLRLVLVGLWLGSELVLF